MAFSRHSLRRVIGDMVHRHNGKNDTINSASINRQKSNNGSRDKKDRNSIISNGSLTLSPTCYERLRKSENEICKSLNYLDQVLTHNKLEILPNIITSLIENLFDIDSVLKGIFEREPESFRTRLLSDVYSLLADLVDWSDTLLISKTNITKIQINDDDKYKKIACDLIQAVKNCVSHACDTSSTQSTETHSDSVPSVQSVNSSSDDLTPALPPKRDKRPVNSSTAIICNRSQNNGSENSLLSSSSSSNQTKQDKDNDERIQLIVDDINHIVEKYTRELDDALRSKTTSRSSSIDYISEPNRSSTLPSSYHHSSVDTLYETHVSKITKSVVTKTTVNNGHGMIDKKESSQIFNETDCSIHSAEGDVVKTQKFTIINRQKSFDDDEHKKTIMTTRIDQFNTSDNDKITNDPPPLPPKRKTARAYMSLFDRYDQNEAELFLRDACLIPSPQRRFEDLFEQLRQHFQRMQILSNSDDSLRIKGATIKNINKSIEYSKDNEEINESNLYDNALKLNYNSDIFLENISHLLVFNLNEDPSLRGGSVDALIIRATSPDKRDFVYQEAFLTTYRTFVSPSDLVDKLVQRYMFFSQFETKKRIARYAFSLLMRLIDEIDNELTETLMKSISNFVTNLLRHGELQLGKLLRRKSLERFNKSDIANEQSQQDIVLIKSSISSKRATLLDFHSMEISEQLTLLDSELFLKIQLSEILYMSIEKGEDYSPNLAAFTEHFNNISYWVRSRILEQNSQRQREVYFEKFLKILKHLRRLSNFNSYLAILSALDCGPLKRLNWSKNIIDSISEHTGIIDSTGSFKNYREALSASVGQPCIPYIGLILSDLTFVHIGNVDYLPDGRTVNFWKRWQQFTILHKLRYCRKWEYKFTRNDRILYFFNNFDDYMNEDAQWIQSEKIKPRQKTNPYA
ncbi:unnamed protein product [Rotaria socialis]|uniref:Uncharacterized protein n=1 Tax=Rotaria socialis TaxID=392032 RepID=A0A820TB35_9BILA|nr:unnamed protein product [Rotaria socialis]CAF4467299.1 unnamed protein product [Rotaria socialis]